MSIFGFSIVRTRKLRFLEDSLYRDSRFEFMENQVNNLLCINDELSRKLDYACRKHPELNEDFDTRKKDSLLRAVYG